MTMFCSNFLSNSLRRSYYDGASLILTESKGNESDVFYSLAGEKFEKKVKLDFSNPFEENYDIGIFGFGSISGILCLHQYDEEDHDQILLWNPATQTIKLLPPSEVEEAESYIPDLLDIYVMSRLHGFGYDLVKNDYKNFGPSWEMYSLMSDSWKVLDVDMPYSSDRTEGTQVYMDGVCHWLCEKDEKHSPAGPCLVSFYLSNEVFLITPISSDEDDCFDVGAKWINLAVLNGSIALISFQKKTTTFHISILGELSIKESWTNLFNVGPLACVQRPIIMGTKGEIFFIKKDMEVAWFDLSTQMIEQLGYKAESLRCRIVNYKESILPSLKKEKKRKHSSITGISS
ncbi:putative F-box associated interaction domain-containing protein [Medicago truncatula]|uniref:Putative F-box associated interaction domain-containing protein n=1 Tax=Medicago truncatula TaxID=3880 RepID=A0A396HGU7_MEDTR|nr:putative F-box associated interaction domain-containing protein [Medicago truncatula]